MLIAGEASGDLLAAELVAALRDLPELRADPRPPQFFGAGGSKMAAAGVNLAFDLTAHSVIGISWVKKYFEFRRLFNRLFQLALERQPEVIIGVDYGLFNGLFMQAIRRHVRRQRPPFNNWRPRLVQYVSPQVWASRSGRAAKLERNLDLLLSIFPFEKNWYARHAPRLRVEFVGHRLGEGGARSAECGIKTSAAPLAVLLPGSRKDELRRHLPLILDALQLIRKEVPQLQARMVVPDVAKLAEAQPQLTAAGVEVQSGGLAAALAQADVAITKSGTVTMECAAAGVPAVVFYQTSWFTYVIGRQIVKVKYIAMPNLLAGGEVYPEFIQHAATPENLAHATLDLLKNETRRAEIKARLAQVIASLGGPGSASRAARAILNLPS